ncbi:DUF2461 domain-containing protein [Aureisphaera galaxeae]|uniref:DUF2461 domain-containing protein n=1 Tax=Aureisphaera galaxeae TaxID=1538023 RepID=UPI0023506581|nr:DUF2461 domain-containing protein [Aureisphaera galaxeae]MDC8003354.1 DUF2461 domain-containing protein [Aureisphaera galaxeae]
MGFSQLFDFLDRLQKNNTKEWMDANRKEYHVVRDFFIAWLDDLNTRLAAIDDDYFDTPGKKAINRINNNLMFFPNKPIYKDHFGAGLDQVSKQGDFYIEIGVKESFLGGGYWYPSSKLLKSIRDAIDYNGEELKAVLQKPSFKKMFGGMIPADTLTRAPKGFDEEHPHIDLLKMKCFAAGCYFTRKDVMAKDFDKKVMEVYKELLPFRRYLNEAVSV